MAEDYQFRNDVNVRGHVRSSGQGTLIGTGSDHPEEGDTAIRDGKVMVYENGAWKEAETRFDTLSEKIVAVNAKADGIAEDVTALGNRVTGNTNDIAALETRLETGLKFTDEQERVLTSGITADRVLTYDGYQEQIDAKQDKLSSEQIAATTSGITSTRVSTYDGYATTLADKASASDLNEVRALAQGKQDPLSATSPIVISNNVVSCPEATTTAAGLMSAADKSTLDRLDEDSGKDPGADSATVAALRSDVTALQDRAGSIEGDIASLQASVTSLDSSKLGKGDTAAKATADANGNSIADTYATKASVENAGYITRTASDLTNYYLKSETYTKEEVNGLITPHFTLMKVDSLESVSEPSDNVLYLVASSEPAENNSWGEYLYVNGAWEKIGTTESVGEVEIDTSQFVTNAALSTELAAYTRTADMVAVARSGSYNDLTDKPTIPDAANNGTLTITVDGESKGTFTANSSIDVTIPLTTPTVPTKVSELTNDKSYVTTTDQTDALAGYYTKSETYSSEEADAKFATITDLTAYRKVADSYTKTEVDAAVSECQKKCITVSGQSIACTTSDTTYSDFPYTGIYSNTGIDAADTAVVTFSVADATSGNLAPVCATESGAVRIYSKVSQTVEGVSILIVKG